jgi:ElaB/YqjD/DUF883 family membrane-anchored ribosome-binding protein
MEAQDAMNKMDQATEALDRIQENAKHKLTDWSNKVVERSKAAASTTDSYVREYTWSSVAMAALLGVVVGLMIRRP